MCRTISPNDRTGQKPGRGAVKVRTLGERFQGMGGGQGIVIHAPDPVAFMLVGVFDPGVKPARTAYIALW